MRQRGKLSPTGVNALVKKAQPGFYPDGAGLYLRIGRTGAANWAFRYMRNRKAHELGLGSFNTIGLAEAREKARLLRNQLLDGIDLIAERARQKAEAAKPAQGVPLEKVAALYIADHAAAWKSTVHRRQWEQTLATYVHPTLGARNVAEISTGDVLAVLKPIWTTKPETASRLRQRIEALLDYAASHDWRQGDNPARWKGHLANVLPKPSKVRTVQHHAAVEWRQMAKFMDALRRMQGMAARAVEFTALTAARSGEVRRTRWREIDMKEAIWTVPAERMKAGKEHRVPLSDAAMAVLHPLAVLGANADELVFPGGREGRPLSDVALSRAAKDAAKADITVHGLRSAFRDWAAETGQPSDIAEVALAHTIGNKTAAAYQRGDLLERRRKLMEAWARYCAGSGTAQVVPLQRAAQ